MPFLDADFATCRHARHEKFGKIYRTKGFSRLRSDLNRAALAIKTAAMQDDETSPAAALARFQLTLSSCVRCRSGLRAAPFSEQACGLVVLLQPFREPFVAKASHTIAVVSSRERCLRVASSFLERAKLDQRCCRAPEPASEFFLRCYCLPIAWTAASLTACARSSFMLAIAPASRLFGLIAHAWDRALWDRKKPHARQAFWQAKRGAKPDALPVHPWSRPSWLMMRRCAARRRVDCQPRIFRSAGQPRRRS